MHDIAEVDGRPVTDRDGAARASCSRAKSHGWPQLVANRNAAFNIGTIRRNFNEPTLPLLLLGAEACRQASRSIGARVERIGDSDARDAVVHRSRPADADSYAPAADESSRPARW